MTKFTSRQLAEAQQYALEIEQLEAAKDAVVDYVARVRVGHGQPSKNDPLGQGMFFDITIQKATIREQLAQRLAFAHARLKELGVDLVPGGGSSCAHGEGLGIHGCGSGG